MTEFDLSPYKISPEAKAVLEQPEVYAERMNRGENLQSILGWSDEIVATMFQAARSLYEQKRYDEAADAFVFLVTINPTVPSFWISAGMVAEAQQDAEKAVQAYRMAILYGADHYPSYAHAARCYMEQGRRREALAVVTLAEEVAQSRDDLGELGEKIQKIRNYIEQEAQG